MVPRSHVNRMVSPSGPSFAASVKALLSERRRVVRSHTRQVCFCSFCGGGFGWNDDDDDDDDDLRVVVMNLSVS